MTPERWQQMKAVFQDAWMLSPGERPAFLEKACGEDSELRADVESLLAQEANTSDQSLPRPIHELVSALAIEERTNDVAGRRIGPYRVVREIGKGGMGRVLEAVRDDDQFQQRVAIKVLLGEASGEDFTRRFRHERQILAGLDHPNIARLLDGGVTSEGQPYFVMEYVSGQAIDDYCRARRLGVTQQLGLFQQVCAAVEYAHQNLVVHRDLKPGNILVTDQGTVKLLDFGIAKLLDVTDAPAFHPATRTGFHLMTPEYASPEQVRGLPITTSTDIYSLGVVLYELLTGSPPYRLKSRLLHEWSGSSAKRSLPGQARSPSKEPPRKQASAARRVCGED